MAFPRRILTLVGLISKCESPVTKVDVFIRPCVPEVRLLINFVEHFRLIRLVLHSCGRNEH